MMVSILSGAPVLQHLSQQKGTRWHLLRWLQQVSVVTHHPYRKHPQGFCKENPPIHHDIRTLIHQDVQQFASIMWYTVVCLTSFRSPQSSKKKICI